MFPSTTPTLRVAPWPGGPFQKLRAMAAVKSLENFAFSEVWNFKVDSTALSVIDLQNTNLSMSVYPNPASENVNLDVDLNTASPVTILMYDITGNLVKNIFNGTLTNGKSHFNIDRDGLSQGVYLIQVISENGINTARVVLD